MSLTGGLLLSPGPHRPQKTRDWRRSTSTPKPAAPGRRRGTALRLGRSEQQLSTSSRKAPSSGRARRAIVRPNATHGLQRLAQCIDRAFVRADAGARFTLLAARQRPRARVITTPSTRGIIFSEWPTSTRFGRGDVLAVRFSVRARRAASTLGHDDTSCRLPQAAAALGSGRRRHDQWEVLVMDQNLLSALNFGGHATARAAACAASRHQAPGPFGCIPARTDKSSATPGVRRTARSSERNRRIRWSSVRLTALSKGTLVRRIERRNCLCRAKTAVAVHSLAAAAQIARVVESRQRSIEPRLRAKTLNACLICSA